jgi:hypothetical protein
VNRFGTGQQGSPREQRGFLLMTAVILIVVVALLATVITFLSTGNVLSSAGHANSAQALFLADSGLEYEQRRLAQNLDWYRSASDPMPSATRNLGAGTFTVYSNLPATMLRRRIPNAGSTADICVYTIDRLPTSGYVQVEDDINSTAEFIQYFGTTSSSANCGNRPALTGIIPASRNTIIGGVNNAASAHGRDSRVYPVTTLMDNLAASVTCVTPAQLRIADHPKFLSAGTISLDDGTGVNAEEIAYASSTRAGGVMTLKSLRRLLGANCPAWLAGAPVTPLLVDSAFPDFEAEIVSQGAVDVTTRVERKTVQR